MSLLIVSPSLSQKPIALHGHERAITKIKYNQEGDLIFSAAKDSAPNVWYSINGERLGTYDGHVGAVWSIDCSWDSTRVVTGAADYSCRIWDCETGKELTKLQASNIVRTVLYSYSGNEILYTTDHVMNMPYEIIVIDVRSPKGTPIFRYTPGNRTEQEIISKVKEHPKATSTLWGLLDQTIITGHENGMINRWDIRNQQKTQSIHPHTHQINDLQYSADHTMFITASKDFSAKLLDSLSFDILKTYKTGRPVNSAAISPKRDHVVLGGGQEAMSVTTTDARQGQFQARFFHMVFEEEFAGVKGHFGPINSLAFHPDGKSFATGGEDGFVRLQSFDQDYYDFQFEY